MLTASYWGKEDGRYLQVNIMDNGEITLEIHRHNQNEFESISLEKFRVDNLREFIEEDSED